MSYIVLNTFIDTEHKNILYKEGDVYPKAGFNADPQRVAYLQSDENKYKKAFLGPGLKDESKGEENSSEKAAEVSSEASDDEDKDKVSETEKVAKKGTTRKNTSAKK